MPKFAANLSMMYPELPFLDRFDAAAKDGFRAVEYLFPYAFAPAEIVARLQANGLQQVLFNSPPGGTDAASIARAWDQAGDKGTACQPGREAEFRAGVALALDYAQALGCPRIHAMAGLIPPGLTREAVQATYVDNLRWAAVEAAKQGVDVLIEPINTRDIPRFFLNRQDHAHEILAEVGAPNLKVQMDLYHCQIVEGDVAMKLRQYLPTGRVGHLQIAGVPERHEPDIGELNYGYLFGVIDEVAQQCGWDGWIGGEYRPRLGAQPGGTRSGLGWFAPWR
ncbi:2-oxo-tetronate isomerase [Variovorax terrae]|uniref:Hydroxypyruvate isomerase family protein n=1 Tax=Variovorax terrae TaxID=2923278 RepID=A0A9X1W100_9BURK|nr:2-oxo-tetronate isomerase [Variovorax terrae]MCJ0765707.1 hydroxypyruvate isomerase family protein [Variovorax terrae]